jgi:hypothetical protein
MSAVNAQRDEAVTNPVASPAEGETLIKHLLEVMDALLGTVEEETALVRAGKLAEAAKLEAVKAELSGMYVTDTTRIRAAKSISIASRRRWLRSCAIVTTCSARCCR